MILAWVRFWAAAIPATPAPRIATLVFLQVPLSRGGRLAASAAEIHHWGAEWLRAAGSADPERETPVLRYFLREQRDKIADLEARLAELESALL